MKPEDSLKVAIAHDPKDIAGAIERALGELTLDDFRDKVVAIKPNDTTAHADDRTACTSAESLRATIRFVKRLHPKSIVVTGGAGAMKSEDVAKVMGYTEVIASEGVEWFDHNQPPFEAVDLAFGPQRKIVVNPRVLTYEKVVSLAQLKVHSTATVTLSIKNVAMSFPCADFYGYPRVKQERHPHNILVDKQAFLVGMLMRFPIDLGIVVGQPAMIGKGPIGGKAVDTGLVIAGRNPVSVDSVGAHLLGFETLAVQHIRQAAELGLGVPLTPVGGESGKGRLAVVGIPVEEATRIFRRAAYGQEF
ncbi:hypothetical protein OJF2_70790 [Aquisphaera giovannonii]|uniref:DUF362 domain-containing protein n=1 Tax=Aquisphaera giovannonii TaxID=406548 RepID=A0A5B9WCZ1_9BACT|nr:DUF362 domain-containing protein [Aquisphaera giovannonii]QEH38476.1 hypothetical protein OJF2_70790 [Aquisphaera giovannonii]